MQYLVQFCLIRIQSLSKMYNFITSPTSCSPFRNVPINLKYFSLCTEPVYQNTLLMAGSLVQKNTEIKVHKERKYFRYVM